MSKTKIAWCDQVWNPVVGCTPVSEGCRNCYAKKLHDMRHRAYLEGKHLPVQYAKPFDQVQTLENRLNDPLHWREPRRVFVNSMSDLFHDDVPDGFIFGAFMRMAKASQHTFMILTKRPKRMQKWIVNNWMTDIFGDYHPELALPNVQLGVSITSDKDLWMVGELLKTPAAVRFVSYEPALGPIDFKFIRSEPCSPGCFHHVSHPCERCGYQAGRLPIDWVICGGETGPGARPMHPDWARSLRDQCTAAKVPFFFKSWGDWYPAAAQYGDPGFIDKMTFGRHCICLGNRGTVFQEEWGDREEYWCGHQPDPDQNPWFMEHVGARRAGHLLDGVEWRQFPAKESCK
ncbi:MAG: phage Gp37/Gp68 family protein [Syntrophobacteraceae bacterium]